MYVGILAVGMPAMLTAYTRVEVHDQAYFLQFDLRHLVTLYDFAVMIRSAAFSGGFGASTSTTGTGGLFGSSTTQTGGGLFGGGTTSTAGTSGTVANTGGLFGAQAQTSTGGECQHVDSSPVPPRVSLTALYCGTVSEEHVC